MNKLTLITFTLLLSACVSALDSRPEPYLKSEELLQQGLQAYQNDNFVDAQQKFSQALLLYQSFDNHKGIALAQLNLLETALASSDFSAANRYLKQLKQPSFNATLEPTLQRKVRFLNVKLQLEQQQYQAALATLQPLLAGQNTEKQPDETQLNLLAMQARLEVLIAPAAKSAGLSQFETALAKITPPSPHYQALLKQILATEALHRRDYQTATTLLNAALAYHKEQAQRRSIAFCLEQLADVEIAQRHPQAARDYLAKALVIRQWLKNDYKSQKIRQQLIAVEKLPIH